jgi:hypothetical protein
MDTKTTTTKGDRAMNEAATESKEVFNIATGQDVSTGKWIATCYSPRLGSMTQYGQTKREALENLRRFVVDVQGVLWPADSNEEDKN